MHPSLLPPEELAHAFNSDLEKGLTSKQIEENRKKFGGNIFEEKKTDPWIMIFLRQFKSSLIYVLLAAALLIFIVGSDKKDAFIILGILLFNAIIGTIQEGRAQKMVSLLQHFVKDQSLVIRDGKKILVDSKELVVGDLLLVQEGQRIPADARLIKSDSLTVDEAMLTGESTPIEKIDRNLTEKKAIPDQINMIFCGSSTLSGSGVALITAVGKKTELGAIEQSIEHISIEPPLKKELDRLSHIILITTFLICVALLTIGLIMGKSLEELLTVLAALFICVIPEGLPVVMTLVLVTGVYRMAQEKVLVKNMQIVESLGRTNVLVIDKTGTLTYNEMMVTTICINNKLYTISGNGYNPQGEIRTLDGGLPSLKDQEILAFLAQAIASTNKTEIVRDDNRFVIRGDPTQAALVVLAQKIGLDPEEVKKIVILEQIPFSSEHKMSVTFLAFNNKKLAFIIGAPEVIMQRAHNPQTIQDCFSQFLNQGLRTLAIAYKFIQTEQYSLKTVESDLEIIALLGIQDAIRSEAKAMVEAGKKAGITILMATGDHQVTALYVARAVGIFQDGNKTVSGEQLEQLDKDQLEDQLESTTVYYRVLPHQKIKIIDAWHKKNALVGMTGDGINDAPSLVAADVGIGMGVIGTNIAQQASDIILLDDSFASIIKAIKQGRHIFYALQRVVLYFLATNMGELLLITFALLLGFPLPLTAVQILWLNLVTDGFLDTALAMEKEEKGLLAKHWLTQKQHLINSSMLFTIFYLAIPMATASLGIFAYYYKHDAVLAHTLVLILMALFQWFNAFNCRSLTKSIFQLPFFGNRWLLGALGLVFSLQLLVVYLPWMQAIFDTKPLTVSQWLLCIGIASSIVLLDELRKQLFAKHQQQFD